MSDDLLSRDCNAAVIRDLATGLSEINNAHAPKSDEGRPFVVVPDKYRVHDLEPTLPQPISIRARPDFNTLDGLISYVDGYKGNDTAIFVNLDSGRVVAIIDYHGKPAPAGNPASWCHHCAVHTPDHTVEWQRWIGLDDHWLDQRAFAEFIENNVNDIVKPSGAEMLEIASSLEAKTAVDFKSGVRLENGSSRLTFNSSTEAKA